MSAARRGRAAGSGFRRSGGGGQNTNASPSDKGARPGGKWLGVTVHLSKHQNVTSVMLQTYAVVALCIGQVWEDALPQP